MNFVKIFQSIEEVIYELALWLVLIPKTLYKILKSPLWIYDYIEGELNKDISKRFSHYLSPVLFFVIIAVIPALYLKPRIIFTTVWVAIQNMSGEEFEDKLFARAVTMFLSPVFMSILLHICYKKEISRDSFKLVFYCNCYIFSVRLLAWLISDHLNKLYEGWIYENIRDFIWIILSIWFVAAEANIVRKLQHMDWVIAVFVIAFMLIAADTIIHFAAWIFIPDYDLWQFIKDGLIIKEK